MNCYKQGISLVSKPRALLAAICSVILIYPITVFGQQSQLALVSVNGSGTGSGNRRSGDFGRYQITPDGRYVVFYSEATDIVPQGVSDIFVRDLLTGQTKMVSINMNGTGSTAISVNGLISDDGRYVAFTSHANNLVNNDTNTSPDVFVRDMQTATTKLVSINAAGTASGALAGSNLMDMTPDGRFIVFSSGAQDLTPQPDGNGLGTDIYVRDMLSNVTRLVSINVAGTASGNAISFGGDISANGRFVVFTSDSSNLVANDSSTRDVFLRDLQTGTTTRLSTNAAGTAGGDRESSGAVIDKGGRFVVFATRARDLSTLPDGNELSDIFIYDVQTNSKKLITVNTFGTAPGGGFTSPGFFDHGAQFSISDDGRFVAFMSQLTNLATNDTNGNGDDIFLYNVQTHAKTLVSVNLAGNSGTSGASFKPSISADGRFVAFESFANDLVTTPDETNGFTTDVFVRDVVAGQTFLGSINNTGTRAAGSSFEPRVTADGRRFVFVSRATDLIANDLNGFNEDVFVFTLGNEAPLIFTEQNTDRAIALDSAIQTRDPFALVNPLNFSADHRTRISLFVSRLTLFVGESKSAVTIKGEDGQGTIHILSVEHIGSVSGAPGIQQIVAKLPDGVTGPTDLWLTVTLRGLTSNRAFINIKP